MCISSDRESGIVEQADREAIHHEWYMRPVFFVSDIQRAIAFYVGKLGFEKKWHEADGKGQCAKSIGGAARSFCAKTLLVMIGAVSLSSCRVRGSINCLGKSTSGPVRRRRRGGDTTFLELKTRTATIFLFASRTFCEAS
jgi:hypothetical protein